MERQLVDDTITLEHGDRQTGVCPADNEDTMSRKLMMAYSRSEYFELLGFVDWTCVN